MKTIEYLLHGIDDLIKNNVKEFENVIKSNSNDILCVGTGLEDICTAMLAILRRKKQLI